MGRRNMPTAAEAAQENEQAKEIAMQEQTTDAMSKAKNGRTYCVAGLVALIAGVFVFGLPLSILAIYLGDEGIKRGATTFGKIVKWGGVIELGLTIVALLALAMGS